MQGAPSVSYPVGRSFWYGALLLGAWTLGAAACGWWAWAAAPAGRAALGLGAVAACGAWAVRSWWHQPAGLLAWDGAAWTWSAGQGAMVSTGSPAPALDLQHVLLLRWNGPGAAWLWVERRGL